VNQIVNGKQGISPAMSRALGEALGFAPEFFADLRKAYDVANANPPDPSVSLRARMQANYPIREMVKRGWLKDGNADELAKRLMRFFEVGNLSEVPYLAFAAKTPVLEQNPSAIQLAWLFRVRQIAKTMVTRPFSEKLLASCIPTMRQFLSAPEGARHVPRVLAECGVRFVVAEGLPHSKIDGVCFWLGESSPVIGISTRFDRIDNFWFVLRHEIEHVLRRHGGLSINGMIDAELVGERAGVGEQLLEEERVANAAAADFCVPEEKITSFITRKSPLLYEKDVVAFSRLHGIHPGITVGQIQYRTGRYDFLKRYQVKIRQYVLPGARVDGWGQTTDIEEMTA